MNITDDKVHQLEEVAMDVRETIVRMLAEAESGHTAGPLGMADMMTAFYFIF